MDPVLVDKGPTGPAIRSDDQGRKTGGPVHQGNRNGPGAQQSYGRLKMVQVLAHQQVIAWRALKVKLTATACSEVFIIDRQYVRGTTAARSRTN